MSTATTAKPRISAGSLSYIRDIVKNREVMAGESAEDASVRLEAWLANPGTTQKAVSEMIDRNKTKPRRSVKVASVTGPAFKAARFTPVPEIVKDSKYAIVTEILTDAPDRIRRQTHLFVEVKVFRKRRVIRQLIGSPGSFDRWFLPAEVQNQVLAILSDEETAYKAMVKFGELYSVCGRCSAELTDDQSRERKIGPVCWKQIAGWRASIGM
jgi:hypothetical protein